MQEVIGCNSQPYAIQIKLDALAFTTILYTQAYLYMKYTPCESCSVHRRTPCNVKF